MSEDAVSSLAERILAIRDRAVEGSEREGDFEAAQAVLRSLRQTLAAVLLPDFRGIADGAFVLSLGEDGEPSLRQRGRLVPVEAAHLLAPFEACGVVFRPGERILPDPVLVRRAVEDALVSIATVECGIRKAKENLFGAWIASREIDHGRPPAGARPSSEVA